MKIFDLTGTLKEGMWDYGEPFIPYSMKRISSYEEAGSLASEIRFTSHTGTHVDCTRHFGEERESIENIPLESFMGRARLVDVSGICAAKTPITSENLKAGGGEKLEAGDICIMRTGWDSRWECEGYVDDYPYLSVEAVEYLRDRGIKFFGCDIPILGDPHLTDADMVLCEAAVPSAYALVNLDRLPEEFMFAAFPLKIASGDGSPVRAVAWTE